MNSREFRRNCKCNECEYRKMEDSKLDLRILCSKRDEVIEDMKQNKDKCRYSK